MSDAAQRALDAFYWEHGPCCAGCDWWRALNPLYGECHRSAMISGTERAASLGMRSLSVVVPAGHAVTDRKHHCGDFKDEFDWSSLTLAYRKDVGAPTPSKGH